MDETQKQILEIKMGAAEDMSKAHRQEFQYAETVRSESQELAANLQQQARSYAATTVQYRMALVENEAYQ